MNIYKNFDENLLSFLFAQLIFREYKEFFRKFINIQKTFMKFLPSFGFLKNLEIFLVVQDKL